MSTQAMKQALEAILQFRNEPMLEHLIKLRATDGYVALDVSMDTLRAALAEAERVVTIGHKTYVQQGGYLMGEAEQQGPVAWGRDDGTHITNAEHNELLHHDNWAQGFDTAFYTHPQPAIPAGLEIQVIMDAVRCHGSRLNNDEILSMLAAAPKPEDMK